MPILKPRAGAVTALDRLARMKAQSKAQLVVNDRDEMCDCGAAMSLSDSSWVCASCGKNGSVVESSQSSIHIAMSNNQSGPSTFSSANGRFDTLTDTSNNTYQLTFARLEKRCKRTNITIPLDILRETARKYAEMCCSTEDPVTGKVDKHRYNFMIYPLLQRLLEEKGFAKSNAYICALGSVSKSTLTKSKNKLQSFIKNGALCQTSPTDRIPSFVYSFLTTLGMETSDTDIVVAIIRRADVQVDMIGYRTCQDNSKVIGSIWILIRQLNLKIPHQTVSEKCEGISKSTYMRYVEFLDINRRRINPILVAHRIRPIPQSFAMAKSGRESRILPPLDEAQRELWRGKW